MSELRFYFDESVELAVSEQLVKSGFDAVSAHSLDALGDDDASHLSRATEMGRVLCTYDQDFLRIAKTQVDHAGIIFAQHQKATIGAWVKEIRILHGNYQAEDVVGRVIFLSVR